MFVKKCYSTIEYLDENLFFVICNFNRIEEYLEALGSLLVDKLDGLFAFFGKLNNCGALIFGADGL